MNLRRRPRPEIMNAIIEAEIQERNVERNVRQRQYARQRRENLLPEQRTISLYYIHRHYYSCA